MKIDVKAFDIHEACVRSGEIELAGAIQVNAGGSGGGHVVVQTNTDTFEFKDE